MPIEDKDTVITVAILAIVLVLILTMIIFAPRQQNTSTTVCVDGVAYFRDTMTPKYQTSGQLEQCAIGKPVVTH